MSGKERQRLEVLSRVKEGGLRLVKAGELLGLSYRQARRIYRRYRQQGDRGLVHRLRGRPSNHQVPASRREKILASYQERYRDFGPTLACEWLWREAREKVAVETLRRWLLAQGLWSQKRRRKSYRQWRARREHEGELIQMDGSEHDWFEGRGERAVLMVMIDDASNRTFAQFFEGETTQSAMVLFRQYVKRYGVPRALYVDQDSIYRTTQEPLGGRRNLTQFGRAMERLSVKILCAHSPQAKGRVERRHGVFQDRLIKEMRLLGIEERDGANRYLREVFLPDLNRRFTQAPKNALDLHRRLPRALHLDEVLCFEEKRRVQRDWTVLWRKRFFQLASAHRGLALAGREITVRETLDGTLHLLSPSGGILHFEEIPQKPAKKNRALAPRRLPRPWRPSLHHPWRRLYKGGDLVAKRSSATPRNASPQDPSKRTFLSS